MFNYNLSLDTTNLGQASQNQQQQRRPRHGKIVYDLHAQFISFYDKSQPSPHDIPVFWQGSRDRGSLKFRFRTRDGGSICILLDDGNYELCMPLECVTYLGMLPINDKNAQDPETLNINDDNYALHLERCLSSGRITFELGVDENAHFDFRRREPNRYVRDHINTQTRDAAYKAKHIKITIHHSVTNELATAMIALVVRSLKAKFYPQHLLNTSLSFNKGTCSSSDDLWYISPRFNVSANGGGASAKTLDDYHLEDILGIYNKSTKSPSLSPASSLPTLSPVSPDTYLPLPMTTLTQQPRQLTSYMGLNMVDSSHMQNLSGSKGITRSQSQMMRSLGRLSIDDLGGVSATPSPSPARAPNVIVGGGAERPPGHLLNMEGAMSKGRGAGSSSPPLKPSKVGWTRAGRAQSIGTIGDRRKVF